MNKDSLKINKKLLMFLKKIYSYSYMSILQSRNKSIKNVFLWATTCFSRTLKEFF